MRPLIHSTKHIVQFPFDEIGTGTRQNILLAQATESTVANAATEVEEGATIKAVFVELWLQNDGTNGTSIVTLTKDPLNGSGPTFTEMAALFTFVNKKNILYTHEGLTNNESVGNPVNIMSRWFKIPKGKQRFGLGDKLNLNISNTSSGNLHRCGMSIYKEYT